MSFLPKILGRNQDFPKCRQWGGGPMFSFVKHISPHKFWGGKWKFLVLPGGELTLDDTMVMVCNAMLHYNWLFFTLWTNIMGRREIISRFILEARPSWYPRKRIRWLAKNGQKCAWKSEFYQDFFSFAKFYTRENVLPQPSGEFDSEGDPEL